MSFELDSKAEHENKIKLTDKIRLSDIEQLRKSRILQELKIRSLETFSSITATSQTDHDYQVTKLTQSIEELKLEIKNLKPKKSEKKKTLRLLLKNDYCEILIREWNYKIEIMETNFDLLKDSHKNVLEALSEVHLKNEYQEMIDVIRKDIKNTTIDFNEANSLLKELRKIAFSVLPPKVAQSCKTIQNQMDHLKLKLEDVNLEIYKKHLEISKMNKEILALKSALESENRIQELYEKKIANFKNNKKQVKAKLNTADNLQKKQCPERYSSEEACKPELLQRNKSTTTLLSTSIDDDDRDSVVGNNEILEVFQEKLMKIEESITTAKSNLEAKRKYYESLKEHVLNFINLKIEIKNSLKGRKLLSMSLQQEVLLRKTYYNQIEDLKGKVRVFCRCRPISQDEINRGNKQCVSFPDAYTIAIVGIGKDKGEKEFQFDKIFTPNTLQEVVFNDTSKLLQSAFDGFNVCIFAYGQTGSGKTFTLIGNIDNNPGIVPRAFERIFEIANEGKIKYKTEIQCYMLELYNEKLLDLLAAESVYSDKLEIKKDPQGMVIVSGAETVHAANNQQLKELFIKANNNRHTASTKMNSESSRSHLIISIIVTCYIKNSESKIRSKISIIDLAGSERMAKSGVQGVGVQEALAINMSLSALGDVISALTSGQPFIPYRNNKLTMLMQDSIGGNAKTIMFVNISPVDYNLIETASTLTYGTRVKLIKNDTTKAPNSEEIPKYLKIIESLEKGEDVIF